jgi:thiol-disulfide isomerase/thioredoxin
MIFPLRSEFASIGIRIAAINPQGILCNDPIDRHWFHDLGLLSAELSPIMKTFGIFLVATLSILPLRNSYGQENLRNHSRLTSSLIEGAVQTANRQDKLVLLYFGAEGCVYCEQLSRVLSYEDIHSVLEEQFVLVRIDVGEFDKNMDLFRLYMGKKTTGIPALAVLGEGGSVLGAISGEEWGESDQEVYDCVMPFLLKMKGN